MIWQANFMFFFLVTSIFHLSNQLNVDLTFSLQERFQSDLILLEKETANENLAKKFIKFQGAQPKAFIGFIAINNDFELLVRRTIFSGFKNIILVFNEKMKLIEKLIEVQNNSSIVISSVIWILFTKNNKMALEIGSLIIPYNSRFYLVNKIDSFRYEIIEVYQIGPNTPKIYCTFALWENKTLKFDKASSCNRMDLVGHEVQLATTPLSRSLGGLYIWDLLSVGMNFTYKVALTTALGGMSQNGSKTGIFKAISDGNVDAGPDDYVVSNERLIYFDFIFPTKIAQAKIYVAVKQGMLWSSFIAPFKFEVWITITVWIILASIIMLIIQHTINFHDEQYFDDPVFLVISAFSNQSRNTKSKYFTLYVCVLMPYLLTFVLFQCYSGILLSYLTTDDFPPPLKNFRDIVNDKTYKISSHYPSFVWFYLNSHNDSDAEKIKKLLVPKEELVFYNNSHFQSLCLHHWVYIGTPLKKEINVNCNIIELPDAFLSHPLGIITKKNFPYKQNMRQLLIQLQSTGFLKMHLKDAIQKFDQDFIQIHVGVVAPIFLIFITFTILSGIILLCEIILWKLRTKKIRIARYS